MGCAESSDTRQSFEETCVQVLKGAGSRITHPRLIVIRCLASANKPLRPPEIFEYIREGKNDTSQIAQRPVDKVSIYRILMTLHELGLVHRVMPSGAYIACSHQEGSDSYHILSRCQACNRVEESDIPNELVAPLLKHMQKNNDFTPNAHLLHIEGYCASCSYEQ